MVPFAATASSAGDDDNNARFAPVVELVKNNGIESLIDHWNLIVAPCLGLPECFPAFSIWDAWNDYDDFLLSRMPEFIATMRPWMHRDTHKAKIISIIFDKLLDEDLEKRKKALHRFYGSLEEAAQVVN